MKKEIDKKAVSDLVEVTLATLQANLCAEIAKLEPIREAQGSVKDSAAGAITALRAVVESVQQTRESLPK